MSDRSSPGFIVSVIGANGKEQRVKDSEYTVTSISFIDSDEKTDKLTLTIDNFNLENFDDHIWQFENIVRVSWGYLGNMSPTHSMVIKKVSGFTTLTVEAQALSAKLANTKRQLAYDNMTRSQVAQVIAKRHKYPKSKWHIQETKEVLPTITQANMTDGALMKRLAHKQGFQFYIDKDGFHFKEREFNQRVAKEYIYYSDPGQGDIISINMESDGYHKPKKIKMKSYNAKTGKLEEANVDNDSDGDRDILADFILVPEFSTGKVRTGSRAEQEAKNANASVQDNDSTSDAEEHTEPNPNPRAVILNDAIARYRRAHRQAVKMTLNCVGDPKAEAKRIVKLAGVGKRLSGRYYVPEITHNITASGYNMSVKITTDGDNGFSRKKILDKLGIAASDRILAFGNKNGDIADSKGAAEELKTEKKGADVAVELHYSAKGVK